MLDYWREFKILTGIDSKTNPKNEVPWNNRNALVGKKKSVFFIKIGRTPSRHYQDKRHITPKSGLFEVA